MDKFNSLLVEAKTDVCSLAVMIGYIPFSQTTISKSVLESMDSSFVLVEVMFDSKLQIACATDRINRQEILSAN